ncbi:PAS domain-containing sensor histidine kinase [Belnapia sp. F-4-1]|uniref:hybrid sensor histidine kinase/response regulator n=1 Tax=Belnapia sp. F-4-1 TaxID=1545443 RepID=UPI000690BC65|nr:PAS domain-containing sensor histidine kinase [Belnapia sp. F-4-1]
MISDITRWLLDPSGLTPHGFCLLWEPWLIWTHGLANIAIGLAYFSIPLALAIFARRRRDLVFRPVFWLFAAFILLCGTGHWMDLLTLWVPAYGAEAIVKVLTAAISVGTAVVLWPLMPRALALPSVAQMQEADAALRESEARHRANFIGAPVPLHVLDPAGRIVEVSNRWLDLLGYSRKEVLGRAAGEFQEDGGAATRAVLDAVFAGEVELRDTPRRMRRRDGAVLDVLVSSRVERASDGTSPHLISALVDVTSRKRAEEARRESERDFRLLINSVTDYAIYMLDTIGCVTNWNAGAERIKGYQAAEIIGEHFSRFYTEDDREEGFPQRALATAARHGHFEDEGWRVRKDGRRFWASVVIAAIYEDGKHVGFAKVTRDISERREAQRTLDAAREQLAQAQKMEAIGQLTGGIAHDFNNVLQAVTGNLELIRRRLRDERPDVTRLATNALAAAEKASGLTGQLLAFARRQRLEPQPLDPAGVVEGMRGLLIRSLGERIALSVEAEPDAGACLADCNQLESALLNLAINARDAFAGATGTLTVSIRKEHVAAASEGWPPDGEYVRIAVRDDGPGMPEEVRRRAFEPFFTTKGPGKGTGLGLAQIHGFAHQSGGTAQVKSSPGHGTEVAILLPRSNEPVRQSDEPSHVVPEPEVGFGETVLVVDDDAMVRTAIAETLRDLRYHVVEAANADAALAMLDYGISPNVVLSDVSMPGTMDGVELAVLAHKRFPGIPVVLATGRVDVLGDRPLPSGVGLLRKPLSREGIAAAIRRALTGEREPVGA